MAPAEDAPGRLHLAVNHVLYLTDPFLGRSGAISFNSLEPKDEFSWRLQTTSGDPETPRLERGRGVVREDERGLRVQFGPFDVAVELDPTGVWYVHENAFATLSEHPPEGWVGE